MRSRIMFVVIAVLVVLVMYNSFPKAVRNVGGRFRQTPGNPVMQQTHQAIADDTEDSTPKGSGLFYTRRELTFK